MSTQHDDLRSMRPPRTVRSSQRDAVLDAWSALHGGIDPRSSLWIRNWVLLSHACARPLVRIGATPDLVTILGVLVTAAALGVTFLGGWWTIVAAAIILLAALLDGIDGAIAALTGTASKWGRVLDTFADRCSDLMLAAVVVVVGAPVWLGLSIAALTLLMETTRATAQSVGMTGPGAITVWERPSRVILAIVAAVATTVWGPTVLATGNAAATATGVAGIGATLALIGTIQLLVAVRRQTRDLPA